MWLCISDSEARGENFNPQRHHAPLYDVDLQSCQKEVCLYLKQSMRKILKIFI